MINNNNLTNLAQQQEAAAKAYIRRLNAIYENGFPEQLKVRHKKDGTKDHNDNVRLNLLRDVVDYNTSSMVGENLGRDLVTLSNASRQAIWDAYADQRQFIQLWLRTITSGDLSGQPALLVSNTTRGIKLTLIDPLNFTIKHDSKDFEDHLGYTIEWMTMGVDGKTVVRIRQDIDITESGSWMITDSEANGEFEEYRIVNQEVFPYPFCPVTTWQNMPSLFAAWGEQGTSQDQLEMMERILLLMSQTMRSWRMGADPILVGKELPTKKRWGKSLGSRFRTGPSTEEDNGNSNPSVDFDIVPGTIIQVGSEHGSLTALSIPGDTEAGLNTIREFKRYLNEVLNKPDLSPDIIKGNLSGVALQMLYKDHQAMIEKRREGYTWGLKQVIYKILFMLGDLSITPADISIEWPPVIPQIDMESEFAQQEMAMDALMRGYTGADMVDADDGDVEA